MLMTGGCVCGELRYELQASPIFTQACHCKHCQRSTGSAFMLTLVVELRNVQLVEGRARACEFIGGSGQQYDLNVCPGCGTALWANVHGRAGGLAYLRAGTLDDSGDVRPQAHIFTRSKQDWLILGEAIPAFPEMYELAELWPPASIERLQRL